MISKELLRNDMPQSSWKLSLFTGVIALGLALSPVTESVASVPASASTDDESGHRELTIDEVAAAIDSGEVASLEILEPAQLEMKPNEDFRNYKVVGRGIRDRRSGQVLKLACVGKRLRKSDSERKCDVLNFLYTDYSGVTKLIGAPFRIRDGAEIQEQLQDQLRRRGLKDDTMAQSRVMAETRNLFERNSHSRIVVAVVTGVGLPGGLGVAVAAGASLGAFVLLPDLFVLPFALSEDAEFGNRALKMKNISALQDRTKLFWQVAPQNLSPKRFQKVYSVLSGEPVDEAYLQSLDQGTQEEETDVAKSIREKKFAAIPSPESAGIDLESPCFVDRIELDPQDASLNQTFSRLGQDHELGGSFPEKARELAIIHQLRRHGYTFDTRAILDGKGHRGSVLRISSNSKSLGGRLGKLDFLLTLSKDRVPLAEHSVRFKNIRSTQHRPAAKDVEKMTIRYFKEEVLSCEEALDRKKTHFVSEFF